MSPTVSIILPTFNRLNFLPATLESIWAQTFTDWELIIADDGSDEETKAYLRSLGDSARVKVLWLDHTGRPAIVRNAALREAQGTHIAFQDSDDLWRPDKLEKQIVSLRSHGDCEWSYTKFLLVDETGSPTEWMRRTGGWPTPHGWILDKLVEARTSIALPSVLATRKVLERVGGFDEELIRGEDYDLWLRLAAESAVDAIEEPLTLVRRHAQHFSGDAPGEFENSRRSIEKLLRSGDFEYLQPILRRRRATLAAGLARSHAIRGNRASAVAAISSSLRYAWPYPAWWVGAFGASLRVLTPGFIRTAVRGPR